MSNNKIFEFFKPVFDYKIISFFQLLIGVLWGLSGVILLVYIYYITNALEEKNYSELDNILVNYTIIVCAYFLMIFLLSKKGWVESYDSYNKSLNIKFFDKFFTLTPAYVDKYGTGKIIDIIGSGIRTWGLALQGILEIVPNIMISIIATVFFLTSLNYHYAIAYISIYICFLFFGKFLNNLILKYRKNRRENKSLHTKQSVKMIMSKSEILYADKIDKEIKNLNKFKGNEIYWNKKMGPYMQFMFNMPQFTMYIFIAIMSYFLFDLYRQNLVSLTEITVSITAVTVSLDSINKGIEFYKNFTKDYVDIIKLKDFFKNGQYLELNEHKKDYKYVDGAISIKNVSFGYGENLIFKNFSLDIIGGKITALVGPSGGGKTTLVKLISANLDTKNGDILLDNQNYNEINKKSLYKSIGYLSQDPQVFDGSVLDNLLYSNTEINKNSELLKNAIKNSSCDFLHNLANGLDTEIGERGVRLSGGQKQRLAIAKLFLKNPDIVILDEPTSALDSISEDLITKSLHKLFVGRTVIIIAHRLQTVKSSDEILFIENGKILERGTHKELDKLNGKYKQMLALQTGF